MNNAYNYLVRYRYLDILLGYGVGKNAIFLLRKYWDSLIMSAKAGGYCGNMFKGYQGFT